MDDKQFNITFAPGFTNADYPDGLANSPIDEQIQAFENSYRLWILSFANKLLEMPDSGFAVLHVLNAYPDMIAQMHGYVADKYTAKDRYILALGAIFPETKENIVNGKSVSERIYLFLRNGLAHMSFIGDGIMLSEKITEPIGLTEYKGHTTIAVNPKRWYQRIENHFSLYISALHDPNNIQLRQAFAARFTRPS